MINEILRESHSRKRKDYGNAERITEIVNISRSIGCKSSHIRDWTLFQDALVIPKRNLDMLLQNFTRQFWTNFTLCKLITVNVLNTHWVGQLVSDNLDQELQCLSWPSYQAEKNEKYSHKSIRPNEINPSSKTRLAKVKPVTRSTPHYPQIQLNHTA